jgi:Pyruvate phosphate dikinase, AMP/ATP-binding domain
MLGFLPRSQSIYRAVEEFSVGVRTLAPPVAAEAETEGLSVPEIRSIADFDAVTQPAADLVGAGRLTKFLIDRRAPANPRVLFVNSNFERNGEVPDAARYHFFFAKEVFGIPEDIEEFNNVTYFTHDKRYVAGVLHSYLLDGAPAPILGYQFYPLDVIHEGEVVEALRIVADKASIPQWSSAFVPMASQQTTATVADQLGARGFAVLPLDRILGSADYIALNTGEAWGHLRIFPSDADELLPSDIPVFDELPLDLSVVAGVITKAVQDTNSHVNLKSKERDTPNVVLRSAGPEHPRLAPFADQPLRLVVAKDGFTLEATTEEEVARRLAERLSVPLVSLTWERDDAVRSVDELAAGSAAQTLQAARRYGSKAANLGFLAHRAVLGRRGDVGSPSASAGYDLVPGGVAVPLQMYRDFVDLPANQALRRMIDEFVVAEQAGQLSPRQRAAMADGIRAAFMAGAFPEGRLGAIRRKIDVALPGISKVKVRSSANAEDIPKFDGAGLHDSYAARLEKADNPADPCSVRTTGDAGEVKRTVHPKSLGCAIRGVYASLWNKRAIEERSFARIDQTDVAMGLLIVPAYDNDSPVEANAVVVTRVLNTTDLYGYSLSVQRGNNLVTNPDPGTYSEVTIANFYEEQAIRFLTTRYAKPEKDAPQLSGPVLTEDQMVRIVNLAKVIERVYCAARPGYFPQCEYVAGENDKPKSLDMEIKILSDGRLVYKQVREFGGR